MKIYDCFQFFDENMMLDLRLNILIENVHKFVIVENSFMHSGTKKKPVFDINNFPKFKDKIIYILIDELPKGLHDVNKIKDKDTKGNRIIDNTLMIEHNQRNQMLKGLSSGDENDLVIVSDVDEIPDLEKNDLRKIDKKLIHFKITERNSQNKLKITLKLLKEIHRTKLTIRVSFVEDISPPHTI